MPGNDLSKSVTILKILSTYIIGLFIGMAPLLLVASYTTHSSIYYLHYFLIGHSASCEFYGNAISAVSSSLVFFFNIKRKT
jgi:hypothetical protein